MTSIAYRLTHKRMLAIDEIVEEWPVQDSIGQNLQEPFDEIPDLVREIHAIADFLKKLIQEHNSDALPYTKPGDAIYSHSIGSLLYEHLDMIRRAKSSIDRISRLFADKRPEGWSDLLILEDEMTKTTKAFAKKWMLPDKQRIERSKKELAEGKFITL